MRGERAFLLSLLLLSGCVADFDDASRVSQREADELARSAPFPGQVPQVEAQVPSRITTRPDGTC